MNLLETFQMAVKNILSSKVRTLLTMLGIIIGVCAVIVIVGLGNGMQAVSYTHLDVYKRQSSDCRGRSG